jgi:Rrf2 family iron-sulfur cluster assembly transcriptional regulator
MRLTRAGEYAVRCVLYLSTHEHGAVVNRKEIAGEMDIPDQFLSKIGQQLARAGILEIVQGSKGGFRLLVEPENLRLLDVVEAVIGEIFLNDCLMRPESCHRSSACAVNRVWEKARNQLRETLREPTFANLLQTQGCLTPFTAPRDVRSKSHRTLGGKRAVETSR